MGDTLAGREIFVPGIGQYENIGDIILRRQLLEWLRPLGRLHVYVGASPPGYDEGLGLAGRDVVYRSFSRWYRAGMALALRGRADYVFKPGEIQLSVVGMREHVSVLPLIACVRLRGGVVLRIGAGSRNFAPLPRALMRPSLALTTRSWWRDAPTARYLGGEVMPDLAFGEGDAHPTAATATRDCIVVSMRGDRAGVSPEWLEGVRRFAAARGLRVVAVTQVARDAALAAELATRLGGECVAWTGSDHGAMERQLSKVYRGAQMAISDRLHVLIAGFIHGAVPVGLQMDSSGKIARHFEAIGLPEVAHDASRMEPSAIVRALEAALDRAPQSFAQLESARACLMDVRQQVAQVLAVGRT